MEITQDTPMIVNESYIERTAEQLTIEEQFPTPNIYENNRFRTKFKVVEYTPNKKNSKRTVFSGLLRDYPNGIELPDDIFEQDKKYNLRIISPLRNATYKLLNKNTSKKVKNPSTKRQTLEFHSFNDNTGVATLDKVLSGDDMGYTWGSKISYGVDLKKSHLNLDYAANLYTRRRTDLPVTFSDKRDVLLPQDFLDEVLFTASLDTKKQNKLFYQDYSTGLLYLGSCNDDFFLTASSQQKLWHSFLSNFVEIFIPNNQKIESDLQLGMVLGFHEGLYLPVKLFDWLNFSMDLKVGGRLSTIPHASYLDFATSADLTYKRKQKSLVAKLNLGSNTMLHDKGLRTILSLGSSIGTENFQFGINFLKPFGDAFQMYKFDDKREGSYDLIGETFVQFRF